MSESTLAPSASFVGRKTGAVPKRVKGRGSVADATKEKSAGETDALNKKVLLLPLH